MTDKLAKIKPQDKFCKTCGLWFGEWQDIATAPRTSKAILVYVQRNKCIYTVCWRRDEPWEGWVIFGGGRREYLTHDGPTHWMPLPAPPGEQ